MTTILIIDDHALFRDGLSYVLDGLNMNVSLLQASSYESAIELVSYGENIDLVLLDLDLPGISNLDALKGVAEHLPSAKIVILSGNEKGQILRDAFNYGAKGYIPKSTHADVMVNALKLVLSGGVYIPEQLLANDDFQSSPEKNAITIFSPRRQQVLELMATGKSNKEIARDMSLTDSTVRVHVTYILNALGASNRTHAVQIAVQQGLVSLHD